MFLMTVVFTAVVSLALAPTLTARPGGEGSGTQEYDCGGSCHEVQGTLSLFMWASNTSPTSGSSVKVVVNVSGTASDAILGVMIVASKSPSPSSLPSSAGWTIVETPSGVSTDNYYEIGNYAGSTSMSWTLNAPSAPGIYTLFARVMHGLQTSTTPSFEDSADGIVFVVGSPPSSGGPLVVITSVTSNEVLQGTVQVDATVITNKTVSYAVLRLGDEVIGNLTSEPFTWTINTDQFVDGDYMLNVTVADSNGARGYSQIQVSVGNAVINQELVAWVWTMVAGIIAILAWVGILIVVVLMIRHRTMRAGGK